jgi:hypothetical protein
VNLKVITKAQENSLAKVQDQNHVDHIFGKQGVIDKEFVPEGQTVNSAFYVEDIGRLLKRISRVRPQFLVEGTWFCWHDNDPSHSELVVKIFLAKHGDVEISHPSYSPDLATADFVSFLWWKLPSKKKVFRMFKNIK